MSIVRNLPEAGGYILRHQSGVRRTPDRIRVKTVQFGFDAGRFLYVLPFERLPKIIPLRHSFPKVIEILCCNDFMAARLGITPAGIDLKKFLEALKSPQVTCLKDFELREAEPRTTRNLAKAVIGRIGAEHIVFDLDIFDICRALVTHDNLNDRAELLAGYLKIINQRESWLAIVDQRFSSGIKAGSQPDEVMGYSEFLYPKNPKLQDEFILKVAENLFGKGSAAYNFAVSVYDFITPKEGPKERRLASVINHLFPGDYHLQSDFLKLYFEDIDGRIKVLVDLGLSHCENLDDFSELAVRTLLLDGRDSNPRKYSYFIPFFDRIFMLKEPYNDPAFRVLLAGSIMNKLNLGFADLIDFSAEFCLTQRDPYEIYPPLINALSGILFPDKPEMRMTFVSSVEALILSRR